MTNRDVTLDAGKRIAAIASGRAFQDNAASDDASTDGAHKDGADQKKNRIEDHDKA